MEVIKNLGLFVINKILPHLCGVCEEIELSQPGICQDCWPKIKFIEAPFCKQCGIPIQHNELADDNYLCVQCINKPPHFKMARSLFTYTDTSKPLILHLKHGDKLQMLPIINSLLRRSAVETLIKEIDIICCVPLHYKRALKRKFNQSALIANELYKIYKNKNPNISFVPNLLIRAKNTDPQGHLSPQLRKRNVKNAFQIHKKFRDGLRNKTILIVDDVFTTGSTINECCLSLKATHVKDICVLTLARVIKEEQ